MNLIEDKYVRATYSNIAQHFSSTRYSHWNTVKKYLEAVQFNAKIFSGLVEEEINKKINFLDFGCGNGKYLSYGKDFNTWAVDNCEELLGIVAKNYPNVHTAKSDVSGNLDELVKLGLVFNSFDCVISVAVIHHLSTESRRIQMIKNIFDLMKSGGTCLISGWATTLLSNEKSKSKITLLETGYPNDYLIKWNNKFDRYYHLFESKELEDLIEKAGLTDSIVILEKVFECDNWVIIFEKL